MMALANGSVPVWPVACGVCPALYGPRVVGVRPCGEGSVVTPGETKEVLISHQGVGSSSCWESEPRRRWRQAGVTGLDARKDLIWVTHLCALEPPPLLLRGTQCAGPHHGVTRPHSSSTKQVFVPP